MLDVLLYLSIPLISIVVIMLLFANYQMNRLPAIRPSTYRKDNQPVNSNLTVLIGDSITHGRIGSSYFDFLKKKLNPQKYHLINAGVNGDLAWNIAQRLDEIIDLQPDIVTLMIGTNDANGSLSSGNARIYRRTKKIPCDPNTEWYREQIRFIVSRLKAETNAIVGLISIPTLGEDQSHLSLIRSSELAECSKEVAQEFDVKYLPLHEKMLAYIKGHPSRTEAVSFDKHIWLIFKSVFQHYILRRSWNRIAEDNGFSTHIDHIHLNDVGANIAAELIYDFLLDISS